MNRLSARKRANIAHLLVEGCSIRTTTRITGVAKNTVIKLVCDLGKASRSYQDQVLRDLPCKRIQCDELWSFCQVKQRNLKVKHLVQEAGDLYTWTAICADTKLVPTWYVGSRGYECGLRFMRDLKDRLPEHVQLTSDAHPVYAQVVPEVFGSAVDFAILKKSYGGTPNHIIGSEPVGLIGMPEYEHASTSFCERQNLNIRMGNRRYTRRVNAFSKKADNHRHSISTYFMYYNFCRIHQTLKTTPAVAAGVEKKPLTVEQMVRRLEEWASVSSN